MNIPLPLKQSSQTNKTKISNDFVLCFWEMIVNPKEGSWSQGLLRTLLLLFLLLSTPCPRFQSHFFLIKEHFRDDVSELLRRASGLCVVFVHGGNALGLEQGKKRVPSWPGITAPQIFLISFFAPRPFSCAFSKSYTHSVSYFEDTQPADQCFILCT